MEYKMYMGLKQKLWFDFKIEALGIGFNSRCFDTTTRYDKDCIWITPYNKGSLWKVKKTYNCYYVYYGTFKKIYANTFRDCVNYINKMRVV